MRQFAASPAPIRQNLNQQPEQRWPQQMYIRKVPAPQVMRRHRATAAPEVHQRQAALRAEQKELQKHQLAQYQLQKKRQQDEQKKRQQEEAQKKQADAEYAEEAQDLSVRTPAPLPSVWRADYELYPGSESSLGGGAFAEVFKVRHRKSQQCVAVKVMYRPNFTMRGIECQIEAEISAMTHAANLGRESQEELFVLQLYDVVEEGDFVYMMLELCSQGDFMRRMLQAPNRKIAEEDLMGWARQLFLGLKTVHSLGFIHRDIKPDNLLCTDSGVLKLADFGWCCPVLDAPSCLAGTFQYMAPEVLENVPQTVQADVWSAGMTLYQMLVGLHLLQTYLGPGATQLSERDPHKATSMKQQMLLADIHHCCPPSRRARPDDLSEECWDFLRHLLIPSPEDRYTVDEALNHPWLQTKKESSPQPPVANKVLSTMTNNEKGPFSSPERKSHKEVSDVPTPLRPRAWTASRNIAYTPPVTPEMTPEKAKLGIYLTTDTVEKENVLEISPESKAMLKISSDRVTAKWGSPKDTLTYHTGSSRAGPSKPGHSVASPPKAVTQVTTERARRKTICVGDRPTASPLINLADEPCRGVHIDEDVAQVLLSRLESCTEEVRETRAKVDELKKDGQSPLPQVIEQVTLQHSISQSTLQSCQDALGASLRVGAMPDVPEDGTVQYASTADASPKMSIKIPARNLRRELQEGIDVLSSSAPVFGSSVGPRLSRAFVAAAPEGPLNSARSREEATPVRMQRGGMNTTTQVRHITGSTATSSTATYKVAHSNTAKVISASSSGQTVTSQVHFNPPARSSLSPGPVRPSATSHMQYQAQGPTLTGLDRSGRRSTAAGPAVTYQAAGPAGAAAPPVLHQKAPAARSPTSMWAISAVGGAASPMPQQMLLTSPGPSSIRRASVPGARTGIRL
eukprot:TRINITY_DN34058_c0_g1_i1.p1 TRINITY_DN34058_c0_g1~~TRINITY_DN34058_c0_g1_i1.p1  ORF type:complete len:911 (-),score=185.62 TRINITY_DN34058_c0_g1_i1:198-2930(-)